MKIMLSGHKLPYQQSDVPIDGWSIECRVYAEVRIAKVLQGPQSGVLAAQSRYPVHFLAVCQTWQIIAILAFLLLCILGFVLFSSYFTIDAVRTS